MRQDGEYDVLQLLTIKDGNHINYLTLEMEERNFCRLRFFSNRRFIDVDEISEDVKEVLRGGRGGTVN